MAILEKFYETQHLSLDTTSSKKRKHFQFNSEIRGVEFSVHVNDDETASLYYTEYSTQLLPEAASIFHELMKDNSLGIKAVETRKSWLKKNSINSELFAKLKYFRCIFENDTRLFLITESEYNDFIDAGINVRVVSNKDMPLLNQGAFTIQCIYAGEREPDYRMNAHLSYRTSYERFKDVTVYAQSNHTTKLHLSLPSDDTKAPLFPRIKTDDGKGGVDLFFYIDNEYKDAPHIDFSNIGDEVTSISRRVSGNDWDRALRIKRSLETFVNKDIKVSRVLFTDILLIIDTAKRHRIDAEEVKIPDDVVTIRDVLKEFSRVERIGIDVMKKRNQNARMADLKRIQKKMKDAMLPYQRN